MRCGYCHTSKITNYIEFGHESFCDANCLANYEEEMCDQEVDNFDYYKKREY